MKWVILSVLLTATCVRCYHVLCVFPLPSRSHNLLGKGVVMTLLDRGFQVTWVTPYPEEYKHKNLKVIDVSETQSLVSHLNMMDKDKRGSGVGVAKTMSLNTTTALFKNKVFLETVKRDRFDAVFTEWFFSDVQAGLAAVLQCPWLLLNGMTLHPNIDYLVDHIQTPAVIPFMTTADYHMPMTFAERVKNTMLVSAMVLNYYFIELTESEERYKEIFTPIAKARGVELPPFYDALHNVSAVFVNSHPAMDNPHTLPQNVFEVAGYHLDENVPPLPEDLQKLLDNSKQGFVYFSMGSVLKSSNFPAYTREALVKILGKLPYTVLWKLEEKIGNLPKNVHVRPWMPQRSILAHPNIKLFITHGGMLSSVEAIHHGVPLLAIPMFGDQPSNAARAVMRGYAKSVPYEPDLADDVEVALKELLSNDRYYKTAKTLSKLFRSNPTSPRNTITHYVKLAIESGGLPHLRSKALLYTWYQRMLLDQLAVLIAILTLIVIFLKKFSACMWSKKKLEVPKKKSKKN